MIASSFFLLPLKKIFNIFSENCKPKIQKFQKPKDLARLNFGVYNIFFGKVL